MCVFSGLFFYYGIGWLVHGEDCFSHFHCAFVAYISLSKFVAFWAFSFHSMSVGAILIQIMFWKSCCFHEYCLFDLPRKYDLTANLLILWFLQWLHYPLLQCSMSPRLQEFWQMKQCQLGYINCMGTSCGLCKWIKILSYFLLSNS